MSLIVTVIYNFNKVIYVSASQKHIYYSHHMTIILIPVIDGLMFTATMSIHIPSTIDVSYQGSKVIFYQLQLFLELLLIV